MRRTQFPQLLNGTSRRIYRLGHSTLNCRQRILTTRSVHTLSTAVAFCGKGSMANLGTYSGDDAFVVGTWIAPGPFQGATLLGVADGVGGWYRYGVNPRMLSQALCRELQLDFISSGEQGYRLPTPRELLTEAFGCLAGQGDTYAGGTTACFGVFDPVSAQLALSNIGDSQVALIRDGKVFAMTERDLQGIRAPRQLAVVPEWLGQLKALQRPPGSLAGTHDSNWQLKVNDLLVWGTDGLWDNVHLSQLERIVESSGAKPLEVFADKLIGRAYYNSLDPYFASPYAIRGLDEGREHFTGGKPDDITIVAAVVAEADLDPHGIDGTPII